MSQSDDLERWRRWAYGDHDSCDNCFKAITGDPRICGWCAFCSEECVVAYDHKYHGNFDLRKTVQ